MEYHMQLIEFLRLLQKRGDYMQFLKYSSLPQKCRLSYAIYEISSSSPKTWTIICNFWNLFPFSKNVDYRTQFMKFLSFLKKHGLSYAISGISLPSPKTWTMV